MDGSANEEVSFDHEQPTQAVREPDPDAEQTTADLLAPTGLPASVKASQGTDNFNTHYKQVEVGRVNVGVDRVNTGADAVHIRVPGSSPRMWGTRILEC